MRRVARELGVDLTKLKGTGEKGRITKDDVLAFLQAARPPRRPRRRPSGGMGIPEIPASGLLQVRADRTKPLPRIKKLSGPHLHRAWLNVPHVTHNDEADITEIDAYRKELDTAAKDKGYPGHAAGLPDEGRGLGAAASSRSSTARCRRRRTA